MRRRWFKLFVVATIVAITLSLGFGCKKAEDKINGMKSKSKKKKTNRSVAKFIET